MNGQGNGQVNLPVSAQVAPPGQGRFRANLVGFNTIIIREFSRIIRIWACMDTMTKRMR